MSDIPLPDRPKKYQPLEGMREHEKLSVGAFFHEHRTQVDARRDHLARLGMDPRHVEALRMPTPHEAPLTPNGAPAVQPVTAGPTPTTHVEAAEADLPEPKRVPDDAEARYQ